MVSLNVHVWWWIYTVSIQKFLKSSLCYVYKLQEDSNQQYFVMFAAADLEANRHTWYLKADIP